MGGTKGGCHGYAARLDLCANDRASLAVECENALMQAMRLNAQRAPLASVSLPDPTPGRGEVRVRVAACGVCRTDLHVVDGELPRPRLPLIPGHEIVGRIDVIGDAVDNLRVGMRVGVPWLGYTCGVCPYCRRGQENLCDSPQFTGYTRDGGYATHVVADARFVFALPEMSDDLHTAPLLCAGLIGWRSLVVAGPGENIGLYGFGAAAHIIAQVARWQGRNVYAFTTPGDRKGQAFARDLGARWAGGSDEAPPLLLDCAIIYAPVGALVPAALRAVRKGGRVVCAGIHMSDIPNFPYSILWEERAIVSVANLTREDGLSFFDLVPKVGIRTETVAYPLAEANTALADLRHGRFEGAAVLVPPI
jgi:propanol-preferring alcohol dehydrogenase